MSVDADRCDAVGLLGGAAIGGCQHGIDVDRPLDGLSDADILEFGVLGVQADPSEELAGQRLERRAGGQCALVARRPVGLHAGDVELARLES